LSASPAVPRAAVWQMSAGAALISTTSIFVRLADVGPTTSAFYRMLFGALMLTGGLIALRAWRPLSLRTIGWLLVPGVAFAVDLMLWHRSIHQVGPGLATLLGNFQVFLMALAGVVLYRERLGPPFLIGTALALVGLYLLVGLEWGRFDAVYRQGVVFGLLTGVAYAVYLLTTRHVQRSGQVALMPAQLIGVTSWICAAVLAVSMLGEGASFAIPDLRSLGALLGLALFGQVLGWILLVRAMPQLPASLVGLLLLLQPALSFLLDVAIFARPTRAVDWLGVGLSLLGIFIGSWRPRGADVASGTSTQGSRRKDV
jgi:drug/metabolite transporter (DMT)-like permease